MLNHSDMVFGLVLALSLAVYICCCTIFADLSQIRPVYAPKDFLEVVTGLQNLNYENALTSG